MVKFVKENCKKKRKYKVKYRYVERKQFFTFSLYFQLDRIWCKTQYMFLTKKKIQVDADIYMCFYQFKLRKKNQGLGLKTLIYYSVSLRLKKNKSKNVKKNKYEKQLFYISGQGLNKNILKSVR